MSTVRQVKLDISGMSCGHCVAAVREALGELEGIEVREVSIGSATVAYDADRTSLDKVMEAIEEAGYTAAGVVD